MNKKKVKNQKEDKSKAFAAFIELSWNKRYQMGPKWMNKWPFSAIKKHNRKLWDKLVAEDKKHPMFCVEPSTSAIRRAEKDADRQVYDY